MKAFAVVATISMSALLLSACSPSHSATVVTRTVIQTDTVTQTVAAPNASTTPTPAGNPGGPIRTTSTATPAAPAHGAGLTKQAARAIVLARHYTTPASSAWDMSAPLNVLIGTATPTADGYAQRAFFFYAGSYIGTDTSQSSARIAFGGREAPTTLALDYDMYAPNDALCCPSRAPARVRFHYNGTRLVPLDPIPSMKQRH